MPTPVPNSVEHWSSVLPDKIAFVEGDRTVTWAQLNELADRFAHGLAKRGVKAGDIVVVRTQIRIEWPVIVEALAKLGCALIGLNWRLTPSETQYVLANSGAQIVICDDPEPSALRESFEGLAIKLAVSIDRSAEGFVDYADVLSEAPPQQYYGAGRPRLILYTSGTTGLPKGVASAVQADPGMAAKSAEYLQDVAQTRRFKPDTTVLLTLPMHHGAGPSQVWNATAVGATTVMLRKFDPREALRLIDKHRVTNWTGVPTMFKRVASLPNEVLACFDVASIRALQIGAAPVPVELKKWISSYFGEGVLSEAYGATEVGMISYLPPELHKTKAGSSGKPHKHVDVSIRDKDGNSLPPDTVGEIWIRSPVTIRNYLNAPPLGADIIDADGYFRVGDVGLVDDDGYIFITDRAKDMIIAGGVNIYPAEVEVAILRHPDVQDAAVIGIPDDEFGEQVKAFCELKPGRQASEASILEFCRDHLASYKRPRSISIVDELPRNTMGKLLKRELREPYWAGREKKI